MNFRIKFYPFDLISTNAPQVVKQKLQRGIASGLWKGKISGENFRLEKRIHYRNDGNPVIRGTIIPLNENECIVKGFYSIPDIIIAFCMLPALFGIYLSFKINLVIPFVLLLFISAVFFGFSLLLFHYRIRQIRYDFEEMIN